MNDNYVLVDLDGTLTYDTAWTPEDCLNCKPRPDWIGRINELSKTKLIIIYTARQHNMYENTVNWLEANGVIYHAINMGTKVPGVIVDADAINEVDKL